MRLAAFVLGNTTYDDPTAFPEIKYCESDASDIFKSITEEPTGLFDPALSKKAINISIDEVHEALDTFFEPLSKDDFVLMFFACHGRSLNPRHLALAMRNTKDKRLSRSALDVNMIGNHLVEKQIKRYALFLDCCRAGAVLDVPGFRARGKSRKEIKLDGLSGTGKWLVASCQSHENAHEEKTVGHGIFSHFIIQGINEGKAVPESAELIDIHSLCVYVSTSINEYYAEIGQEPVFSGGELKGGPLYIAKNPSFKQRLPVEFFTQAITQLYREEDLSTEDQFERARLKRLREFCSLVTISTGNWEDLIELHGSALGVGAKAISAQISEIKNRANFLVAHRPAISSEAATPEPIGRGIALFASTSGSQHAFADAQTGSIFAAAVADGLNGRAADSHGNVSVRSLHDFVSLRMSIEKGERQQRPILHCFGNMNDFAITSGRGAKMTGRKRALLVATDYYNEPELFLPSNERSVEVIGRVLSDAGRFDVTFLRGSEVTAHNVYAKIAAIIDASEPGDCVLFYFGGHGAFDNRHDADDRNYVLMMSDNNFSFTNPATVLAAQDVFRALKRQSDGATLVFIDSSFAGAVIDGPM